MCCYIYMLKHTQTQSWSIAPGSRIQRAGLGSYSSFSVPNNGHCDEQKEYHATLETKQSHFFNCKLTRIGTQESSQRASFLSLTCERAIYIKAIARCRVLTNHHTAVQLPARKASAVKCMHMVVKCTKAPTCDLDMLRLGNTRDRAR